MQLLDICGTIFAFIATIFYIRVNPLAWPVSLIAIIIDSVLYFKTGLYGDVSLQAIYVVMTAYGWWQWKFGGESNTELPLTSLQPKLALILGLIASIGIVIVVTILKLYTDSKVPYWDAITTVLSLIAQWLICRKIIQCWHLWFLIDSLYAGIYLYKGIPAHALLNMVYVGMAVAGYWNWNKIKNSPPAKQLCC